MLQENKKYKPVRIVPFELYDIGDFVVDEHPYLNPKSRDYSDYWLTETRSCIEGKWGYDYSKKKDLGGYRFMPGNLYFYVNMCVIEGEDDFSNPTTERPTLRDIDWLMFYSFAACDGFSGFEDDPENTSYTALGKLLNGEKITNLEKKFLEIHDEYLRKPNGEYKNYVDPKDALFKVYDKPMGKPMFLNEKLNLILLSTRRGGKSFGVANGVVLYDFVFNGARTMQDFIDKKITSTTVVGAIKSDYSEELMEKFDKSRLHLKDNVGSFKSESFSKPGWFHAPISGSAKKPGEVLFRKVRSKDGQSYVGVDNKIHHVTFHNNASAGVGYGAKKIVIEEAGLLSNFNDVDAENKGVLEKRRKFGWALYLGTGGNMKKIQQIKTAFYNPDSTKSLKFYDHFSGSNSPIGLFIPSYYRKLDYKDPQGNTNIDAAWEDEMHDRELEKKAGTERYQRHITSFPIVPEEMFVETGTNIFPVDRLVERKLQLEESEFARIATPGRIIYTNKRKDSTRFDPLLGESVKPITEFGVEGRLKKQEKEGCIVIYEPPDPDRPKPTFTKPLYLVSVDQVRNEGDGPSLCAVIVWKFFNLLDPGAMKMNIVAEWFGRYERMEDNHEMVFKLATHYDSKILPEVNITSIKTHARATKRYHMLQPRPALAIDGNFTQSKKYDVGVYMSPGMTPEAETVLRQLLITPVDIEEKLVGDQYTNKEVWVADQLNSPRVVSELIAYRRDSGNYDGVSAMFVLGIFYLQYKAVLANSRDDEQENEEVDDLKNFVSGKRETRGKFYPKIREENPAFNY